jgi:hypothetical protein
VCVRVFFVGRPLRTIKIELITIFEKIWMCWMELEGTL